MKAVLTSALLMTIVATLAAPGAAACAVQTGSPLPGAESCATTTLSSAQAFAGSTFASANQTANETAP